MNARDPGRPSLVRLRPRADTLYSSRGRTVLATNQDGAIDGRSDHGLFVHETRLLSHHRLTVDGRVPRAVALSNVEQFSWLGYYIVAPPGVEGDQDAGSGQLTLASQRTIEIRVSRAVGEGLHQDVDITNFTQQPVSLVLELEVDADFQDLTEADRVLEPIGAVQIRPGRPECGEPALTFDFRAEFRPEGSDNRARTIARSVEMFVEKAESAIEVDGRRLRFPIALPPRGTWHTCLRLVPVIDGRRLEPPMECRDLIAGTPMRWSRATRIHAPGERTLTREVLGAIERAARDLDALRLTDLDCGRDAWTVAAGLPLYVALFGRDVLTTSWQAAMLGPELMRGTLPVLAGLRGTRVDDWRDEEPGRMLHEAHTGPREALDMNPRGRSYSSITTSAFFPVVLGELWHWTGDRDAVRAMVRPALEALEWLDKNATHGRRFYKYRTRSSQGVQNQAWKDSGDAIVDHEGRQVLPPIATCEEQAFTYAAKFLLSEVLWWLGENDDAKRLFREARELKQRFNDAFWMAEEGYVAFGLDAQDRPIRAMTSNPGHCLAAGIVERGLARRCADRLMQDDLFSGWGVRTLSCSNPAYNPYSYHRGSVWPVEQATFVLGFVRYGLHHHAARLARAQFEAAALFDFCRLPELFSGHARDADHPFPALYPQANSPQAWSASAVLTIVQSLLGLYPYAPLDVLLVDPHLPEWLPELTVQDLRVGRARVTIRFRREADGSTDYKILDLEGPLWIVRQPSPWSLTATTGERMRDALMSLAPGH